MRPVNVTAEPDPRGGRILLSWTTPTGDYSGTRVFRAESTYPDPAGNDGSVVVLSDFTTGAGQAVRFLDGGASSGPGTVPLRGETVYYYAVVAFDSTARPSPAFASALATAPYQTGAYLYESIPGVYRTFDTVTPPPAPTLDPGEAGRGQLRRLLEMFGLQFDLLRSYASGVRDFHTPGLVDGALLPLLAQWIGWQTNFTLPLSKQRNEVRYATHYWATLGIAANLRATLNRLVSWDARFKEFAHNIVRTNDPEQLTISETHGAAGTFGVPSRVTLDVAFEGRPAACRVAAGRHLLFYHARQSAPAETASSSGQDCFYLWIKAFDRGGWLPSRRVTWDGATNRSPAVVARSDGTFWLFYGATAPNTNGDASQLRLQQLALGRGEAGAVVETPTAGPFSLIDGDVLRITVNGPGGPVARDVFFHPEDFANLSQARPAEVAAVLDREVPGIDATLSPTGAVRLLTRAVGSSATIMLAPSTALAKLDLGGLPPVATGLDAAPAILASSTVGPYALADQDTLTFAIDGREPHTATFSFAQFPALAAGAAGDIAQAINQVVPGAADVTGGRLRLLSAVPGDRSMVVLDGNRSTAAIKLGFAAPPPAGLTGLDDAEPSAFEDSSGQVWLFFASRRSGSWNLWYTRFAGGSWGVPKPLTAGLSPDREPSATIDLASGRIWVFWSRKKSSGLWNVFSRRTTKLDFGTIADADWTEAESSPAPADFDNREPAVLVTGADALDLYFASNRADGWNVWRKTASSAAQGAEAAVTSGPFTRRAPAALVSEGGGVIVWLRSNESQLYASTLYSAATTLDARYAGSVTVDTRNPARVRLGGSYADIMRYTYDTPKTDVAQESARRYSHDTIGVFLTPNTQDQQLIVRNQALIAQVLRRFLPIQARAVFPIELAYNDAAYDYETPGVASPRFIKASKTDTIAGVVVGANSAD